MLGWFMKASMRSKILVLLFICAAFLFALIVGLVFLLITGVIFGGWLSGP